MPQPQPTPDADTRDGFIVRRHSNGEEVHFVPCDWGGRARLNVLSGLLNRTDTERFLVADTRDARPEAVQS